MDILKRNNRIAAWKQSLLDSHHFTVRWQVLAGVFCALVLAVGTTGVCWAWFDTSVQTEKQTLTAANYQLTIEVEKQLQTDSSEPTEEEAGDETAGASLLSAPAGEAQFEKMEPNEDGRYALEANGVYTVTLTATGDSTGYAKLTVLDAKGQEAAACRTTDMQAAADGASLQFTLVAKAAGTLQIEPVWGVETTAENDKTQLTGDQWYAVLGGSAGFEAIEAPTTSTETPQETTGQEPEDGVNNEAPEEANDPDIVDGDKANPGTTTPTDEENGAAPSTETGTQTGTPEGDAAKNTTGQESSSEVTTTVPETTPDGKPEENPQPSTSGEAGTAQQGAETGKTAAGESNMPAVQDNTNAEPQPETAAPAQS